MERVSTIIDHRDTANKEQIFTHVAFSILSSKEVVFLKFLEFIRTHDKR